ncbi:MAG: nuclear transport factor 2 family protein [Bacteroidetes bacterium]|nr:nuclear transport factor 2 family protein [Bacteroidota bacterium]MBU1421576.1 nuclear transport factor 2 family protein [Bacteroidota bacterium]MBU2471773.1 nuclear transport factor 2 family protein [Bacteroidota bacterium]MBU2637087.1 nuclear transport factor 2 family protein [Bacteroidota bacterium]
MTKLYLLPVLLFLVFLGCGQNINLDREKENLLKTDAEFSQMSSEKNAAEAFYTYFADNGIQIRPNGDTIVGKDSIREHLTSPQKYILTWEPKMAEVSNSGDLGYTWGTYKTKFEGPQGKPLERTGKYLTVWKKQNDGGWKVIADIGNQDTPK